MIWIYKAFFPVVFIAFILYWRIMAGNTKSAQRLEPPLAQILRFLSVILAVILLSTHWIPLPFLYRPLWPAGLLPFWIGAAITVAGLLFAVWARQHLGRNWSSSITIKQDHELITTGPYALVRHPIYTGILAAILGLAIAISDVRGFVALVIFFTGFYTKLRTEEKWMRTHFGATYTQYARHTSALIPYIF